MKIIKCHSQTGILDYLGKLSDDYTIVSSGNLSIKSIGLTAWTRNPIGNKLVFVGDKLLNESNYLKLKSVIKAEFIVVLEGDQKKIDLWKYIFKDIQIETIPFDSNNKVEKVVFKEIELDNTLLKNKYYLTSDQLFTDYQMVQQFEKDIVRFDGFMKVKKTMQRDDFLEKVKLENIINWCYKCMDKNQLMILKTFNNIPQGFQSVSSKDKIDLNVANPFSFAICGNQKNLPAIDVMYVVTMTSFAFRAVLDVSSKIIIIPHIKHFEEEKMNDMKKTITFLNPQKILQL